MADFDGLKQFFGEDGNTAITYEQLTKGINEKGIKLADLSLGGYVAKDKFDDQTRRFNDYKAKNDVSKYADYDSIKAELETLKTEKADRELINKLTANKVKSEFVEFVLSKVKGNVTEQIGFDKAMETYLKENPQYLENTQGAPSYFRNTSVPLGNGAGNEKGTNEMMNALLRGARK